MGFRSNIILIPKKNIKNIEKAYKESYSDASGDIRSGGYKIYTSFDQSIQKKLQSSVKDNLPSGSGLQGAAVCIDNASQMVIAMVGGRSANGEYNRGF